jgi:hypothetical protein
MQQSRIIVRFVIAALLCLAAPLAHAWSIKEHILLTRIAAERLIADPDTPPDMKQWMIAANRSGTDLAGEKEFFLHQRIGLYPRATDGLGFWATMPDLDKGSGGDRKTIEPFGVGEAQLHFVDLELLCADESRRTFKDDLSHKPTLEEIPRDMKDPRWQHAGMLPFRVEDCYKKFVKSLREGRLTDKPGQYPRDEHAEKWAGYLSHYLEDNCQPHHATVDFMSKSYFGKDNPRSPNVHSDVESRLVDFDQDDYMALREEFWPLFVKELNELKDPTVSNDPWTGTMEVLRTSYDALPLIGRAAMAGYKIGGTPEAPVGHPSDTFDADAFFHFKGKVGEREMTVLEMKAHQMAWGVKRVERVWRQAWDEGHAK